MSEKPILFNAEMVKAILDGRKTMTRRIIKPQPEINLPWLGWITSSTNSDHEGCACWCDHPEATRTHYVKPPYKIGNILWVRETWQSFFPEEVTPNHQQGPRSFSGIPAESAKGHYMYFYYRADGEIENAKEKARWLPSIHMPREAARIFLRVKNVRVERLQDITEKDVEAEGIEVPFCARCVTQDIPECVQHKGKPLCFFSLAEYFAEHWDVLNKKRGFGWDANPWCWVIEFERVEGGSHE